MSKEEPNILQDGHVDIAHPIAQKFCTLRITGQEWQILWVIICKTWAWHRPWAKIGLKEFHKLTGIKKPSILKILTKLQERNIVSKKANGMLGNPHQWHIISRPNQWKPLANRLMSVSKKANNERDSPNTDKDFPIPKETLKKNKYLQKSSVSKKANNIGLPSWLNSNLWQEFRKHRIAIKAKMTDFAEKKLLIKLKRLMDETGASQKDIIEQSIENGWRGLFEVKSNARKKQRAEWQ